MNIWTTNKIRQCFLDYFKNKGHEVVASSSLIPGDDPTLLFTNAGMVQFKGVFLGTEKRKYTRATTSQRCIRASGKHNDLENVGYTPRHHTFFEMLGNFSFGDYFKREAIQYAWEFLTKELGINPEKLWVTVHKDDKEAEELWREEFKRTNTKPQGLSHCEDADNFWAMGETGPCGYCSEIFYDHGEQLKGNPPGLGDDGERYVEIWNLVFMQFERDSSGKLTELPKPSIDTGMGLERIAAVMQGVSDNYATDIFVELRGKFIDALKEQLNVTAKLLESKEVYMASRVVGDHIRTAVFLIAEGVVPSNEKAGYVLRSIIRRAIYYLYHIGVRKPLFFNLVRPVVGMFNGVYPEVQLDKLQNQIAATIEQEEIKFLDTLDRGLRILDVEISKLEGKSIPGTVAFNLHDTYGLPIILTTEIAKKRGLGLDRIGFDVEMEKQREKSRAASKFSIADTVKMPDMSATVFVGYEHESCDSAVCGLFAKDGKQAERLNTGEEGVVVIGETPFYAESGGQVGDSGEIHSNNGVFIVNDTQKHGAVYLHYGYIISGFLVLNDKITARIDAKRRQAIRLNHSATHLLHTGLRLVLGEGAIQRGSYVDDRRLRFDFNHQSALTTEEISEIEKIANSEIRANLHVDTVIRSLEDAKSEGAFALFGEKYGDDVRVVSMGGFSKELCGGTHVSSTGEIGLFKIASEAAIASGIRRIEVVTGENSLERIDKMEAELKEAASILGVGTDKVVDKLNQLIDEKSKLDKEVLKLQGEGIRNKCEELVKRAIEVSKVAVLAAEVTDIDAKWLRHMVEVLRGLVGSGVVVLAKVSNGKLQLVTGVTSDLHDRIKANELLQYLTKQINGSGGGKADVAQGGGVITGQTPEGVLDTVKDWVVEKLK